LSSDVGIEGTSQVVELIKQEIVFGRLRPRERLIEEDLSQKFGASRHQIRAAFTELERIGLVIRRPNKGVVVRELSVAETEQFFEMAALLQAEVAKRIPLPIDPATLQRLEGIYEEYCAAIDRHDLATVSEITNAFHRVMFEASNNICLADLLQQIWTVMLPIRCYAIAIPELLARARQELGYVLEALRASDRRELLRVYVDHIWPTLDAYKRAHGAWSSKPVRPTPALASKEAVNPRRKASA
jgi:DNA-binding GntR family transcriptional regulator